MEDGGWHGTKRRDREGMLRRLLRRFPVRSDFQIGHPAQVNDIVGVVWLIDNHRAATGGEHDKIRVTDEYLSAVCQMRDEWLERHLPTLSAKFRDGHVENSLSRPDRRRKPSSERNLKGIRREEEMISDWGLRNAEKESVISDR